MLRIKSTVMILFAATLLGFGSAVAQQYKAIDVKNGGTITGVVTLRGESPKKLELEITKDKDWCGKKKYSPRFVLGRGNAVRNAVISLESISVGKKAVPSAKYILDQRQCEYDPHVMLVPLGSNVEIVNSDAVLHNVHAYGADMRTVFNIAQPVKGFRFPVKYFKSPGIYSATCDAGHPWMSAYVVVVEHPYYALSDAKGRYTLDKVPPGTYKIKMWHEGVTITKTEMEGGKPTAYFYEPPYEEIRDVTIPENGNVTVDFVLTLRTGTMTQK